ncbi:MAG TPA: shikimate dehydrogenase, partial [Acidobacteriaceae bacterium]|nr:shikimate dehydrogenase [Acidobacteriaceae bacterium]
MSIVGRTTEQFETNAAALLDRFPFQEFRLDYLADPGNAIPQLSAFFQRHTQASFLATCRPVPSGGCLHGSARQELAVLKLAVQAGCQLADLSLESAEELGATALDTLRESGAAVLVSFHDFQRTGDLGAVLDRMRGLNPDAAKIVSTAESLSDSLSMLQFLTHAKNDLPFPLVALAMGEHGALSRILGPRAGSAFTFAAATEAEATAPGQLTAGTLEELYRIRELTPATRLFGVAGDPIHSSLSPLMLNTAFRTTGVDAVYLPLRTGSAEELFRLARELPLDGFSVTMPLKQAVLPFLDEIDPTAAKIGAVNTVRRTPDGRFHGFNTDAAGIVDPLRTRRDLQGARVLILGAGGAARAAVFGCLGQGARVFLHNRTEATARLLAGESGAQVVSRAELASGHFDVLINATPAGMHGNALTLPLEKDDLHAGLVFDLVYNPIETPLLALAKARGIATVPGVEMFVHQGARQFSLWTGEDAPAAI